MSSEIKDPPIASAIKGDVLMLLGAFISQKNLSFGQFKVCWAEKRMSCLHLAPPQIVDKDSFYQLAYDIILGMLHDVPPIFLETGADRQAPTSSRSGTTSSGEDVQIYEGICNLEIEFHLIWNIGVVYFLYTFCCTQIPTNMSLIYISPEVFASLRIAVEQISWLDKIGKDVHDIFELMLKKNLFVFGLATGPATPWGSQRYEDKVLGIHSSLDAVVKKHRILEARKNTYQKRDAPFITKIKNIFMGSFNDDVGLEFAASNGPGPGPHHSDEEDEEEVEGLVVGQAVPQASEQVDCPSNPNDNKKKKKAKTMKRRTLNLRDSVDAVMRLVPARKRTSMSVATGSQNDNVITTGAGVLRSNENVAVRNSAADPILEEDQEDEYSTDSSSDGEQYMSQRERELERMKARVKELDKLER